MNAQVIALVNQKGGVGKSTSCVNLGVGLAQAGKKVLVVDCDPQSSLTISLGHPQPDKLPVTLSDMMGKIPTPTIFMGVGFSTAIFSHSAVRKRIKKALASIAFAYRSGTISPFTRIRTALALVR